MDRIAALNEILTQNPNDTFARYGLAMEYSNQGDLDRAIAEFSILLKTNPDYTPGYFMAAQTLVRADRNRRGEDHAGRRNRLRPTHREPSRAI